MLIRSNWQVKIGNLILLDFGDYLRAEPDSRRNVQNDIAHPLRSLFAFNLRSYNTTYHLNLKRVVVCSSDAAARTMHLNFMASLPTGAPINATVVDVSGDTWTLDRSLVEPGFSAGTESNRFFCDLTLSFGQMTYSAGSGGGGTDGGGTVITVLPVIPDAGNNPFIIVAGTIATVNFGQLLVVRSLQCDGELRLAGELCMIGDN